MSRAEIEDILEEQTIFVLRYVSLLQGQGHPIRVDA